MNQDNKEKLSIWKSWLIRKLLNNDSSKEEILNLIANEVSDDDKLNSTDDNNEKNLIKNILQLENTSVEDVMVPRGEIISVDNKKDYNQIFDIIKEESHSRLPVYENNLDNIIGFFHVKDFIKINKNDFSLKTILREVLYVATKSPILELLKRMRTSRIHIALVVDGIGGVDGLVTIEDLVEEIVGEIEDEHDAEDIDEEIIKKEKHMLEVNSSYRVEDLEEYFKINLDFADEDEVETVGGLVFSKINRIPKSNEEFNIDDIVNIKVLKANERKILTVQIRKIFNDFNKIFYPRSFIRIIIPSFFYVAFRICYISIHYYIAISNIYKKKFILLLFFRFYLWFGFFIGFFILDKESFFNK